MEEVTAQGKKEGSPTPLLETVLFSCDYIAVDQPLHTALELFTTMYKDSALMPFFVFDTFKTIQSADDLSLKRALWLLMLVSCPPIMEYVTSHSPDAERTRSFVDWLGPEFEKLFTGEYHAFDSQILEFVTQAQMAYNRTPLSSVV